MAVFPDIEIGDPVSATLLDSMLPKTYTKQAAESRNTTAVLAADGELINIPLLVGTYEIELIILWSQVTAAPGLRTQWGFTGTYGAPVRHIIGPGATDAAPASDAATVNLGGVSVSAPVVYRSGSTGAFCCVQEKSRAIGVTVAGNLSLTWAQQTSNPNNTTVQPGTSFKVTRLG
ncbi:MAG: hypothetical protein ABWY81_11070 [Jiangellaceae bacterium]